MVRGDIGKHVAVCSEPAPRGVVECQQAAVHQGCGRRAQDVGGERLLSGAGLENGAHPDLGGQRKRDVIHRRASRGLRRNIEMIDDGADDGLAAQVTHRHRRLKRSPDDVDEELPGVRMSRVVCGLANGGETTGQRHHRDGRLGGAVLRSRRAGQHDDADQDGEESASANGLTHEQPRGSELIDTGWRSCRLRWNQPRGRYSAPGDRNYKVNSPRGLSLSFAPAPGGCGADRSRRRHPMSRFFRFALRLSRAVSAGSEGTRRNAGMTRAHPPRWLWLRSCSTGSGFRSTTAASRRNAWPVPRRTNQAPPLSSCAQAKEESHECG